MRKKRITSYIMSFMVLATIMSLLTGFTVAAKIHVPTVEKDVYIYDEDDIINDDVEKELNQMLLKLNENTEVEFAVISVESLLDTSIEDYANNLFNTLGIGNKENGILLLFSRSDEKVRLEIGRGLEGYINGSKCEQILDDYFVPYLENGKYTEATEMTVKTVVLNVIAEEYGIDIQVSEKDLSVAVEENPHEEILLELMALCILIICIFVIVVIDYL